MASNLLIWISNPPSDITTGTNVNEWHLFRYGMEDVYITNGTSQNIKNNIITDSFWNNYCMNFKYGNLYKLLKQNCCVSKANHGELYQLSFNDDEEDNDWLDEFSGAYPFSSSSEYRLHFTSKSSSAGNVIINVMVFSPALLELRDGDLTEVYPNI